MTPNSQSGLVSRRDLLVRSGYGLGAIGLHVLGAAESPAAPAFPNFAPKAKRVIFLFQSGGPSHLDLFDHKPLLQDRFGEDIPESVFQGQRVTGMVAHQARFQSMPTKYAFQQHGQSGISLSELLPHTAAIVDDICLIRSVHTEAINHDPAITFFQTGSQLPGRPSMGAWVDYGLGSSNRDLPAFVVLHSVASEGPGGQGLLARLWGAGFLPSRHQGVQFRSSGDPVLYLNDPPGMTRHQRRLMLDGAGPTEQAAVPARRRSGNRDPDRAVRDGLSDAGVRAGVDGRLGRDRGERTNSMVPTRASRARLPRIACLPGGWRSATYDSSNSITAGGTTMASCPSASQSRRVTRTSHRRHWCKT